MNQTEGRASGEVPESQPSGRDLAARIVERMDEVDAWEMKTNEEVASLIRESLAPIREALEESESNPAAYRPYLTKALRLLRGEELSGNRGIDGGE